LLNDSLSLSALSVSVLSLPKRGLKIMTQPQPSVNPKLEEPKLGFNGYAERLNGRAAMVGFLLIVVIEYVTNKGVLSWLGLR
jgi:hypothetical protein